ncbi:MAG: pyridoxamine 5'-phosphate oxidase family protein [Rhodocyclaceae bacterium]|jgi:PPOX class probable FMN-dependent enzyme|nr:pyridoxamine 5'-phosphate oxidase family protein [Rhodocyclaceae bacterium]MCE2978620.1 pyridoxamine 5'-phosphate oxidase family protein [Betaproteobacteria bacterium]MCA3074678.1 pyridoxamine 5'-phosphate oxidase family protein [Rhodocyclaceae bacterium]MCA3088849.1 pyridoxamine 5'-phosphate oxidase family protein [Rhodocyclaceae bacterium]MCA3095585.1 pyridoxamine 5'-phosphate oxidase family protein [Rhodocyclaceae bacterium]
MADTPHLIRDLDTLLACYGEPVGAAVAKELPYIHPHYRRFIEAAPFVSVATSGPGGLDNSPRGDAPGFVRVVDDRTLMLPDRRGNNRLDTLRNLLADPRIALLFLIPGVGETLRVNGRAVISVDPALLDTFAVDGKVPRSVLVVAVDTVYYQCSKALVRSKLWDPAARIERSALPSTGTMIGDISRGTIDAAAYDRELPARIQAQLY